MIRKSSNPIQRHSGLPPVIDHRTEILILGSFPSIISRERGHYFSNPQNQFWRLMSLVLEVDMLSLTLSERETVLRLNRIGLWDVVESCCVQGSRDADIRDYTLNDIGAFLKRFPRIREIFLDGRVAEKFLSGMWVRGPIVHYLPSSSPAHALPFEKKAESWLAIRRALRHEDRLTHVSSPRI